MINEKVISLCNSNKIKLVINEKKKFKGNRTSYYYDLACVLINDEFVTTTIQDTIRFMIELKNFNYYNENDIFFAAVSKKNSQGQELKSLKFKKEMLYSNKAIYINYNTAQTIYSIYNDITFGKFQALSYKLTEEEHKKMLMKISNEYNFKLNSEANSSREEFDKIIKHFENSGDEDLIVRLKKCFNYLSRNTFLLEESRTNPLEEFIENKSKTTWLVYYSNDLIIDLLKKKIENKISDKNKILFTIFYVISDSIHLTNEIKFEDFVNEVFGDFLDKEEFLDQMSDKRTHYDSVSSSLKYLQDSYFRFVHDSIPKLYFRNDAK